LLILLFPVSGIAEGAGKHNQAAPSAMRGPDAPTGLRIIETKPSSEDSDIKTKTVAMEIDQVLDKAARALRAAAVIEDRIPKTLIDDAAGVALFPDMNKAGVLVGGRYGNGILMLHSKSGWQGPVFISLSGASFGTQIGLERTDLFMVFTDREALDGLQKGQLTLGPETSVAAGIWETETGISTGADVLIYKTTEGLFAGLSLSGGMLKVNEPANETYFQGKEAARAYYGSDKTPIDSEDVPKNSRVEQMITILSEWN
jgi:lipid-binding SYLF domain-containing protein